MQELEAARDSLAERLQHAERHVAARDTDLEAQRAEAATQRAMLEQLRKESSAEKQMHSSQVRVLTASGFLVRAVVALTAALTTHCSQSTSDLSQTHTLNAYKTLTVSLMS